jgi:ethanolamine utilization protein EutA
MKKPSTGSRSQIVLRSIKNPDSFGRCQKRAVIITGETARKENAKGDLNFMSGLAGDFVVATAGNDLEAS